MNIVVKAITDHIMSQAPAQTAYNWQACCNEFAQFPHHGLNIFNRVTDNAPSIVLIAAPFVARADNGNFTMWKLFLMVHRSEKMTVSDASAFSTEMLFMTGLLQSTRATVIAAGGTLA